MTLQGGIMEAIALWKEGMSFEGRAEGFSIAMDATSPLGHHYGPSPKEVLLTSLAACSGMDVIGLLKRDHQFIDKFCVEAKVSSSTSHHPIVFNEIELVFHLDGAIDVDSAIRSIQLSQTKYCGISAMLNETSPISWSLILNGEKIANGEAAFRRSGEEDAFQSSYDG